MPTHAVPPPHDLAQTLDLGNIDTWRKHRLTLVAAAVIGAIVIGLAVALLSPGSGNADQYLTSEAQRGDLTVTVSATGALQPVNQVDIGSEISGVIERVEVDFNDRVKRGQVLLRFDTEQLTARVVQARANLRAAEAKLEETKATVMETAARLARMEALEKQQLCSPEDCDAARATHARSQAQAQNMEAQVALARAALNVDESNLQKAVLRSPIDGIVLNRQVEPGQTVAASFQTPVLLTIAEDLRQMELHVAIDEADVGQVAREQEASFTVDAYPNRHFSARILDVHYAPQVVQDVVTYEALLSVDNSELLLRPGMTATADIVVNHITDALLAPNAALRFSPPKNNSADTAQSGGFLRSLMLGPPRQPAKERKTAAKAQQQVWTLRDGQPAAIPVTIGSSDGRMSQVLTGEVQPGMTLLVDVVRARK